MLKKTKQAAAVKPTFSTELPVLGSVILNRSEEKKKCFKFDAVGTPKSAFVGNNAYIYKNFVGMNRKVLAVFFVLGEGGDE